MIGSVGAAAWIAQGVFLMLLIVGWVELGARRSALFAALWLIGYAGSGWLVMGAAWFIAYTAMLDIALVLLVFRGDVHIT